MAGHDVPDTIYDGMLSSVTAALADNPDPDRSVINLARLTDSSGNRLSFYRLLGSHPAFAKSLLFILGTSQFLADLLARTPENLEVISDPCIYSPSRPAESQFEYLERRVMISPWPNGRRDALRRAKPAEILRIAVRDLLGITDFETTVRDISDFADSCI